MAFKDKMSQIIFLFAIIPILLCFTCDAASNDVSGFRATNKNLKIFETRLYSNLTTANKDKNIFYSPMSIEICLAMLRMGASGVTGTEIDFVLTSSVQGPEKLAKQYHDILEKYQNSTTLKIASKIYVMKGNRVQKSFHSDLTKKFFASIASVNFAKNIASASAINYWVKNQTNITDLISSDQLSGKTRLVIVSPILFKDQWASKFNPKDTSVAPFVLEDGTQFDVQMMYQTGEFPIADMYNIGATVLKMPYENSNLSMVIVLPKRGKKLLDVQRKFNDLELADVEKEFVLDYVPVKIPKFKIEFETELLRPLQEMGLARIFSHDAQLDKMLIKGGHVVKDLHVDTIVHKAVIEVDEGGTTAAAATAAKFENRMDDVFAVNKPFYFFIKDEMNNKIFEGLVNNKFSS